MMIKVCGMRDAANIRAVEALGIDCMGFIFWPGSSRYVADVPGYLPESCLRAGVFVDADIATIMEKVAAFRLDVVQLHGSETPGEIADLRLRLKDVAWPVRIVKSISVAQAQDLAQAGPYEDVCDAFLFDTKGRLPGGNGSQFDWDVLHHYGGRLPFLLSGGIGPQDAERIKTFHAPGCMGIDLNSRFETAPAVKDAASLKEFIDKIRSNE